MLDMQSLKRDGSVIREHIKEVDGALVAKKTCYIVLPFRWLQAGLLEIGKVNYCATIFPLVTTDGRYAISNVCTKMEITPSSIEVVKVDGDNHYAFRFDKGDVICPDVDLIMDDGYSYKIYDELIQKAKAPWFLDYNDIGQVMATSRSHSGIYLADTNAIFELIVSSLTRTEDMSQQYREVIPNLKHSTLIKYPRESVPINSIVYAANNKMNKLMGGYTEDGLTSALTQTTSATSKVEQLLRKK